MCGFIEQAKWRSAQTPGAKQKSHNLTEPKLLVTNIHKQPENSRDKRMAPIKKDKSAPAEGDYDTYNAWKKT